MATITEKLLIVIDANSGGAVQGLREVQGAAEGAEKAALKSGSSSGILAQGLERVGLSSGTAAKAAAVGIGAAAVAVGLTALAVKSGIGAYVELADQIRTVKRVTGDTAEGASQTAAQLRATGTDTDAFALAAGRLAKNLGQNPALLKQYGVEVARTSAGNVDVAETFRRVGDSFRAGADQTEKAALANAAFGRGYQTLIPLLSRTRAEQEALNQQAAARGQILDDSDLQKALEYKRNLASLGQEVAAFKESIGKQAVKPLSGFLGGLQEGMAAVRNLIGGQSFTTATTNAANEHARTVRGIADAEADVKQKADDLAASDAFNKQAAQANTLRSALLGVLGAHTSVVDAEKRVQTATADVADARRKLNDLLAKGTVDTKALAAAVESAAQAHRSLEDAQDRAAASRKALDDLFKPATAGEVTDATLAVTAATLAQADAARQLEEAKKASSNAGRYGTGDDQAKAASDLAKANLGVEQAARGLQKAEEDQDRVRKQGQPTAEALAAAQKDLRHANDDLATATNNVAQKEADARAAQLPDPARLDAISAARKTLADQIDNQARAAADLPLKIEAEAAQQAALNNLIREAPGAVHDYMTSLDTLAAQDPRVAGLRDRLGELVGKTQALGAASAETAPRVRDLTAALSAPVTGKGPGDQKGILGTIIDYGVGAVKGVASLFGIGHAAGGIVRATPGGTLINAGEAGHDEVVLSTDPRYAGRNADLLVRSGLASRSGTSSSAGVSVEQHLHFYGDPDRNAVRAGASDGLAELERALRSR